MAEHRCKKLIMICENILIIRKGGNHIIRLIPGPFWRCYHPTTKSHDDGDAGFRWSCWVVDSMICMCFLCGKLVLLWFRIFLAFLNGEILITVPSAMNASDIIILTMSWHDELLFGNLYAAILHTSLIMKLIGFSTVIFVFVFFKICNLHLYNAIYWQ